MLKKRIHDYPITIVLLGLASVLFAVQLLRASCTARAVLEYPTVVCALLLLCPPLERWVGSRKMWQLLGSTGLFALLSGGAMMLYKYRGFPFTQILTPDLAEGMYLACLLAGIALALVFTGGDKSAETFHLRLKKWLFPALLLLGAYCCIILKEYGFTSVPAPNWFFFVYTLSVGAFGGLYFSWQNQVVTNRGVFDQARVLPPYKRIKLRQYPGTLCLLAAIIAIAVATVAGMPLRDALLGGFLNWRMNHTVAWTGFNPETLLKGQLWRIFTAPLLHFGPLHLLGNGVALYFAGKYAESRIGTFKWLCIFYGAAWMILLPQLFRAKELLYDGASVGIYALVAVFLLVSFSKKNPPRSRPHEFIYLLGYVFVGNFISFGPGHFVSFAFGLGAAVALRHLGRRRADG